MNTFQTISLLVLLSLCVLTNAECPTGWFHYERSCYFFSDITLDWFRAESSCGSHNAKLAEISNKAQSDFIIDTARRIGGTGYWLGGRDDVIEGSWIWVKSDKPFTYTAWAWGEPNGNRYENCLHLYQKYNMLWNDAPCTYSSYRFICEKEYPAGPVVG